MKALHVTSRAIERLRHARRAPALLLVATLVLGVTASATAARRYYAAPLGDAGADGRVTLLFIGSDAGPPRPGSPISQARADGFHIVSLNAARDHVSILSFPRDSWVPVPGQGTTKINSCLVTGPETCVETARSLTGIEFDGYILTNFKAFQRGVDAMGGITIDVEQRLLDSFSHSDFQPGVQTLDGEQALAYVRDRKSRPNGDLDRAESHARFIQAAHAQIVEDGISVREVSDLVEILRQTTLTDLPANQLIRLAFTVGEIPAANVNRARVGASIGTVGSASVVFITDAGRAQIADLADDGVISG